MNMSISRKMSVNIQRYNFTDLTTTQEKTKTKQKQSESKNKKSKRKYSLLEWFVSHRYTSFRLLTQSCMCFYCIMPTLNGNHLVYGSIPIVSVELARIDD